jgi:hypothetical protein
MDNESGRRAVRKAPEFVAMRGDVLGIGDTAGQRLLAAGRTAVTFQGSKPAAQAPNPATAAHSRSETAIVPTKTSHRAIGFSTRSPSISARRRTNGAPGLLWAAIVSPGVVTVISDRSALASAAILPGGRHSNATSYFHRHP